MRKRKLSFEKNLRHRLRTSSPRFRYREERSRGEGALYLAVGVLAGLAAGAVVVQRFGGFDAVTARLRERLGQDVERHTGEAYDEAEEESLGELSPTEELEERVLDAYHNDPVLSERAIDIGAIDEGIIELTGWVYAAEESQHAVTVARGVPGVETVVNRLTVRAEEERLDENQAHVADGDDRYTEAAWEGQRVGTGRPRQGNSSEPGRHADPKVHLEDRWMNEEEAFREAADAVEGLAERRTRLPQRGGETDGSPVAPSGVPKADHVARPADAPAVPEGDNIDVRDVT